MSCCLDWLAAVTAKLVASQCTHSTQFRWNEVELRLGQVRWDEWCEDNVSYRTVFENRSTAQSAGDSSRQAASTDPVKTRKQHNWIHKILTLRTVVRQTTRYSGCRWRWRRAPCCARQWSTKSAFIMLWVMQHCKIADMQTLATFNWSVLKLTNKICFIIRRNVDIQHKSRIKIHISKIWFIE